MKQERNAMKPRKSIYHDLINDRLAGLNKADFDPRHIEAYMRLEHSTLDGLALDAFTQEIEIAIACIAHDGLANAERCAKSFGL
jgi:hypothetical protein